MAYPPWIAFIDREGKPSAMRIAQPRDTRSAQQVVDLDGKAVTIMSHVPHELDPTTALARGVAITPHSWIPGFIVETVAGGGANDVWGDNWACNEYTENFNAPPLVEPPWDVVAATYNNGEVRGDANLYKFPDWPAVFGMDFRWFDTISGPTPRGVIIQKTVLRRNPWHENLATLFVVASSTPWNPPNYWFNFNFDSIHFTFGSHTGPLYTYPNTNPWLLDGQRFTATIYEAGRIECNFYGVSWNNGGPT